MIELLGILAGVLILASLILPSVTITGNIRMRVINIIGSILFVIYGFLIPAYSTAVVNIATIILNLFHILKLVKKLKKNQS